MKSSQRAEEPGDLAAPLLACDEARENRAEQPDDQLGEE